MHSLTRQPSRFSLLARLRFISVAAALCALTACSSPGTLAPVSTPSTSGSYTLRLLHINDHHSHLDETRLPLMLHTGDAKRESVLVPVGGFARVATAFRELAAQAPEHTIKIHAGDAITGDLYYSLTDGRADAELMNTVCFDTFTLGNHEFDHGDSALKRFIDRLHESECKTSVLSANVRFGHRSALNATNAPGVVQPSVVLLRDGRRIGLIGITVAAKTKNASRPDPDTTFANEADTAQAEIDALILQGVDVIVLQTHYGYQADLALAKRLRGVDVIIGGDSHTLLGPSQLKDYGLDPKGAYPTHAVDQDGNPVCIAQAGHYGYVVGELTVRLDASGRVMSCKGTPHVLIGTDFQRSASGSAPLTDAQQQAIATDLSKIHAFRTTSLDADALATLRPHQARKQEFGSSVVVHAHETLCARRMPGASGSQGSPGRGGDCIDLSRLERHGGDIQQLVAQAYLQQARSYFDADLSLINAGGVRVDIPTGPVTVQDIYTLLPFKNTLVQLQVPGSLLKEALENAVDAALAPKPSSGAFPYAAGLRWQLDTREKKGDRLSQLEVQQANGRYVPFDSDKVYLVATIDFIADGKDHYQAFEGLSEPQRVNVGLDATQLFLDYAAGLSRQKQGLRRPASSDYSTQAFRSAVTH